MLKGYAGDKIKVKLTITSLEEQPLKITDITSTIKDKIKSRNFCIKKYSVTYNHLGRGMVKKGDLSDLKNY